MRRRLGIVAALATAGFLLVGLGTAGARPDRIRQIHNRAEALQQFGLGQRFTPGQNDFFGVGLTECPHAGEPSDKNPKPLDRRQKDKVEQLSTGGDDVRVNQDYSCMPQNETSIAVNPRNPKNVVAGQNDYRLGWGSSGFDASTDNGTHWHDGIKHFPTAGNPLLTPVMLGDDHIDGGGDPAIVFDRAGISYYAEIHFEREREDNGIFVSRSVNGGFTWTRPCVIRTRNARCGGTGDPRKPGDGVVVFDEDVDGTGPAPAPAFNDKEYIAAGPRPLTPDTTDDPNRRVGPTCFSAGELNEFGVQEKEEVPCQAGTVGVDRIYVTWTRFETTVDANIMISYSDDQGRSWSPPRAISGSAPFCLPLTPTGNTCDQNQFSSPTVNPTTGFLYVGFQNFNTQEENQYLVVRSRDGGQTFEGPFFATFVFDINYPDSGTDRTDCQQRGQQDGRNVLTNSCFRMFSSANMVVDKRSGEFADDLYMVLSDNRNGTRRSTNTDVFFFTSKDGGMTWIGPTRVNNDPSSLGNVSRDCGFDNPACGGNFGADNFYPWVDISLKGDINIVFHDRRLDPNSTIGEWPQSRVPPNGRPGNYLAWLWGGICAVTTTGTVDENTTTIPQTARQCLAPGAAIIEPPGGLVPNVPEPPPDDPVPGQGSQFLGPFKNFTVSDVPSNMDYSFRAGIFMGDYNNVAIGPDGTAYGFWTDARNGRGSGNDGSASSEPGRNPACEQADVFSDWWSSQSGGTAKQPPSLDVLHLFAVTPCPKDMEDPGNLP